ncbi:MAG: T9SS type A sorting domain-containing protein, partial [Bacteroidales bacterium]|nr:T9SS type A sorting domain-containing protein [Bacteroidales bacterium]
FNDGSGTTTVDLISGNDGTLTNMTIDDWVNSTAPVPFESSGDGNWSEASNWLSGQGSPSKNWSRVKINSNITLNEDKEVIKLTIENGKSLTINPGAHLTVSDSLKNNAGNAGLVLKSESSATASLIHNTAGINATVERYIPQYSGNAGWHYISSPVAVQAIQPNFVASPPDPDEDFYKFYEQQYIWINAKDNSGNWDPAFEENFVVGRGYNIAYDEDVTKLFEGELNTGDFTFDETTTPAITYTESGGIGWNLMGNPYPSGLDWDLCQRTNIDGTVYVYDGDNGQYISWNGTVGSLADGIIPPMNAFFFKASENPELTILNDARVHTAANFYKSEIFVEDLLVLKVEGNGFSDQTYIHFNPNATEGFDHDFDAYKLSGIAAAPQLYSRIGETKLSINELPYSSDEITIPLSLKVGVDGDYTISVTQNTFWETVDISLKDLQTNTTYDLSAITQLSITQLTNNSPDRFLLLINGATGIEENTFGSGIEIYSYGNQVFIKTEGPEEVQVGVYNILGQQVLLRNLTVHEVSGLSGFDTGFYLITARTEKSLITKKLFIR